MQQNNLFFDIILIESQHSNVGKTMFLVVQVIVYLIFLLNQLDTKDL